MKAILAAASAAILASASAMANNLDPNNPSGNVVDRFADIEVLRYTVPGFNELSPKQKLRVYYLTEPPSRAATSSGTKTGATTSPSARPSNPSIRTTRGIGKAPTSSPSTNTSNR